MKKADKSKISDFLEGWILIIIILFLWSTVSNKGSGVITILLPAPGTIIKTFAAKIADRSLLVEIGVSISRVLKGFFCAVIVGTCMGIIIGLSEHMYRLTKVFIQILRPVPPIAWIPLVILWLGIGEQSKVFLIFLGGFFVIFINVVDGIRYIDPKLIEVAKVAETPKLKYVFRFIIPAAMPNMFTGYRVGLGTCWSCVVAAELVAASSGVGYMISNARNFGQMDVVIIGIITIGIAGKLMDEVLGIVEKKIVRKEVIGK